jgi:hypothetical protein
MPPILSSQIEDDTNSRWLDNKAESFSIINSSLLVEAFGNEAGFVPRNRAIGSSLDLINP